MEIIQTSLPCTVEEIKIGINKLGEQALSDEIVTVVLKSKNPDFESYYGKGRAIKHTFDSSVLGFIPYEGMELYLNEESYMFTSRDEKIIEKNAQIPILHKAQMLTIIDDINDGLERDEVKALVYSGISTTPQFKNPINRQVFGKDYSVVHPVAPNFKKSSEQ